MLQRSQGSTPTTWTSLHWYYIDGVFHHEKPTHFLGEDVFFNWTFSKHRSQANLREETLFEQLHGFFLSNNWCNNRISQSTVSPTFQIATKWKYPVFLLFPVHVCNVFYMHPPKINREPKGVAFSFLWCIYFCCWGWRWSKSISHLHTADWKCFEIPGSFLLVKQHIAKRETWH